jgi:GT2 family glycosyltransferase
VDRSVAICICTRNRPDALAKVLESIARSARPVDLVVVSDDGHDVGTSDVCKRATQDVHYVRGPRLGLGPNRNHALRRTEQDLVLFLDDDCLLGVDFLPRALACLASSEATYGVGRVIVSGVEKTPRRARKVPGAQTFLGFQSRSYEQGELLTSININCTLFPSSVFARYLFDPLIRYGYDEVDIASRAARGGYKIVLCSDAVNDHRPSADSREDYETFKTASRLYVTIKRYALTERRYARAVAYIVVAPLHAVAAGARGGGMRGARDALSATLLALRYVRLHVAGIRRPDPARGQTPTVRDHDDRTRLVS